MRPSETRCRSASALISSIGVALEWDKYVKPLPRHSNSPYLRTRGVGMQARETRVLVDASGLKLFA